MKYFVIDNFIEKKLCDFLIEDGNKFIINSKMNTINVNRQALFSSSLEFENLITNSEHWKKLSEKINSLEFLDFCKTKLEINKKLKLTNFFKIKKPSELQKLYKAVGNKKIKSISTLGLIKYTFFRFFRDIFRKIKYSKLFYSNSIPVEILYDYSKAGDGYFREIHRDSDSRLIVFLLYLNSLPDETKGGTLDIFKLKDNIKEKPARPEKEMCEKINSIKPKPGRLVVFRNDDTSYHSVEKLDNSKISRCFIYGGFTSLSQKSPFMKKNEIKTEYYIYD